MSTLASLVIKLEGDIAGLQASMKRAEESLDRVEKKGTGLGAAFKNIGTTAAGVFAGGALLGGAQKLAGFLADATKGAVEDAASVARLEQAFKNTGVEMQQFNGWMDHHVAAGQKMAFSDDQVRNSLSLLTAQTGDAEEAGNRFTMAMDLARGANIDVVTASKLLGKVTEENVNVFAKYGIAAKEGMTQTELFGMIQEKFGGQAAAFADSNAGKMEQVNIRIGELKEAIGAQLLPVMTFLLDLLVTKGLPALESVTGALDTFIKYIKFTVTEGDKMNDFLGELPEPVRGIAMAFAETALFIKKHWDTIMAVVAFGVDYAKTRIEGLIQSVTAIVEIVTSVVALITALWHGEWATAWAEMKDIANAAVDLLVGYVRATLGNIPEIVIGLVPELLQAGLDFGGALFDGVVKALEALPGKMREIGRNAANGFLDSISVAGISAGDVAHVAGKALSWAPGFNAEGTNNWRGGLTWVGEKGPELLNLPAGSQIHSNRDSMAMGGIVVNIDTVNARNEHEAGQAGRDIAYSIGLRRLGAA